MPNAVIAEHMKVYGKVKSVAREVWRKYFQGIPNGVRVVRMKIEKPIPSYITIDSHQTTVLYRNQETTCRSCNKQAHPNTKCTGSSAEPKTNQTIAAVLPSADRPAQNIPTTTQHQQQQLPFTVVDNRKGRNKRERTPELRENDARQITIRDVATAIPMDTIEWNQFQSDKVDEIIERNVKILNLSIQRSSINKEANAPTG